jgi:hypothetical protein
MKEVVLNELIFINNGFLTGIPTGKSTLHTLLNTPCLEPKYQGNQDKENRYVPFNIVLVVITFFIYKKVV